MRCRPRRFQSNSTESLSNRLHYRWMVLARPRLIIRLRSVVSWTAQVTARRQDSTRRAARTRIIQLVNEIAYRYRAHIPSNNQSDRLEQRSSLRAEQIFTNCKHRLWRLKCINIRRINIIHSFFLIFNALVGSRFFCRRRIRYACDTLSVFRRINGNHCKQRNCTF